jgi:hypothetical protein
MTAGWKAWGQWVTAAALVTALGWATFGREGGWVPLLSEATLGIHEAGHLFFAWGPRPLVSFGGTLLQLVVPAAAAGYFWHRRDRFSAVLMLAWLGNSLYNVSVYIYDATRLQLALFGTADGSGHDWNYLLGPDVLDALGAADMISLVIRALSAVTFGAAFVLALWPLVEPRVNSWRAARRAEELDALEATLPVREPRNPVVLLETLDQSGAAGAAEKAGEGVRLE